MNKILIPVDGSEYSLAAVKEAKKYAEKFSSDIVLLTVASNNAMLYSGISGVGIDIQSTIEKEKKAAEEMLEKTKESLGDLSAKTETVLKYGDPADQIIDFIEKNDVDLVIMGSKGMGYSAAKRLLVGSVAYKVLHNVNKPILLIK